MTATGGITVPHSINPISSFQMKPISTSEAMSISKIVAFRAQKIQTSSLRSRCTHNEWLFGADFGIHRYEFRSAARVGPSGLGWPYSGDQGLVTIVGPTVVFSVLPTLAANTGNQRCARPSAQLWSRLEPTVVPTLANCFRWPWQFSRPTSGPRLNQLSAY